MTDAELLLRIEEFLKKTGMSATAFGRQALKDPMFVFDLRNGRSPSLRVAGRVEDFLEKEAA